MTRKTSRPEPIEGARIVSSDHGAAAAPALFDAVEIAAATTRVCHRMAVAMQEMQSAQLSAAAACASAMAAAAVRARPGAGLDAAAPAVMASGQAVVDAIRQGQDAWRHSMVSLQEDLIVEMRGRMDAARARVEEMWPTRPRDAAADPFRQVRQSFDGWIASWNAMLMPRPVPIA